MTMAGRGRLDATASSGFIAAILINRDRVRRSWSNGDKYVRLEGGQELPVGNRFAANLRLLLICPLRHIKIEPGHEGRLLLLAELDG